VEDIAELKRLRSENAELRMERDVPSAPWTCGHNPEFGISQLLCSPEAGSLVVEGLSRCRHVFDDRLVTAAA